MSRHQFGAHQHAPVPGDQNREIGLRAVAAAIRYLGDGNHVEHSLSRELSAATGMAPSDEREA